MGRTSRGTVQLIPGIGRRSFNPASLFANSEVGAWYDPSDLSTLFQDAAGTTPVTASGQTVGLHLDKSGNGNHRYQASADSRPQYVVDGALRYLLYDGIDDFLETNAVNFTGTDKMTVWWGGRKLSDAAIGMVTEFGINAGFINNSFWLVGGVSTGPAPGYSFRSRGTTPRTAEVSVGYPAPISNVVTGLGSITPPVVTLRVDGVQVANLTDDQGTGNYGNHKLFFGRRGGTSLPFNGHEHQTIIRGAETDLATIEKTELFVRGKVGITW